MKAGAFTPATPASLIVGRGSQSRSMKAGAFTPATPATMTLLGIGLVLTVTLNEGGGFHPRNP